MTNTKYNRKQNNTKIKNNPNKAGLAPASAMGGRTKRASDGRTAKRGASNSTMRGDIHERSTDNFAIKIALKGSGWCGSVTGWGNSESALGEDDAPYCSLMAVLQEPVLP